MSIRASTVLLRSAAAAALIAGAGLTATSAAAQVAAQSEASAPAAQDESNAVEEIVVTGTLIRGVAPVGTNVIGVNADTVVASGTSNSNDLLARIPQVSSAFNQSQSPGGTIALPIVRPNIRNLGASGGSTTLILLNGKRMVGAGVLQTSPDPSSIPPGMIARVEVIPDGGSSIYGSDAIGGVINFITRKSFDGVQVNGRYGFADAYEQVDADITAGRSWGGGSAMVSYAYATHSNISARDRDYISADHAARGGSDFRTSNCSAGNITAAGVTYSLPSRTPGTNRCDENQAIDFYPYEQRHSLFGVVTQSLSDSLTFDATALYSVRNTKRFGQSPTDGTGLRGSGTITSANPYFRAIGTETSQTVAFNYAPVFGAAESNPSRFTTFGVTPSLTWKIDDNWQLVGSANYGKSTNRVITNQIDTVAQAAALAGTTTATALNPYDVATTSPGVLSGIRNFALYGDSTQKISELRAVADGRIFSLPAGDAKLAVGAEFHKENLRAAQGQGPRGAPVLFRSTSERKVSSVFGELLAPLMGSDSAIGSLDLSASARFDDYDDVGSTTNPKIGLTWRPTPELRIRGNWGTSFHAPSLADTGGAVDTRAQVLAVSPFRPSTSAPTDLFRPTILLAGGNPNLKPETAHTWSIGGDWTPKGALDGLTASLTYFNVDFTDAIGLAPFFNGASYFANPSYASYYVINPTQAQALAATAGMRVENAPSIASLYGGATTPYALIDARRTNLGSLKVDGLDFSLGYSRPTSFGSVNASIAGTYTLNRDSRAIPGAPKVDELKNGTGKYNLVATAGAKAGAFDTLITVNHSDGYRVIGVLGQSKVSAFTTVNAYASYKLSLTGWMADTTLTLNVDNLFDAEPPYYNDADGYANGSTLGRLVSLGVRKSF